MFELQDKAGRLIVVLPMRGKHCGRTVCVFREGRHIAEFPTCGEAARYARALAEDESLQSPVEES
jgi:hypothetical protein